MRRLAWANFAVALIAVTSAGCIEDALRYYDTHYDAGMSVDAGAPDGSTVGDAGSPDAGQSDAGAGRDGGSDSGSGADAGAIDSGGPIDAGGCDAGCTTDWNTFLQCGPSGTTLCFPLGAGFRSTFQAAHGPAAGFGATAVAFSNGGDVWVGIASDGGIALTGHHTFATAISSLSVADEHDLSPYQGCAEAIFTLDGGAAGYLGFCQSGLDEGSGLLNPSLPSPVLGMTWVPNTGKPNLGLALGSSTLYYPEGQGSGGVNSTYPAVAIQGLQQGPANNCATPTSWWIYVLPDAGMTGTNYCLFGSDAPFPTPTMLPTNTAMTATQDGGVAVVGVSGGQFFGFEVYSVGTSLAANIAGTMDAGNNLLGGIARWGDTSVVRVAFLDSIGTPGVADLDLTTSPPTWTAYPLPPGGPGAAFVAPMYPHMLLRVDTNGQVSITYLPP